MKNKIIPIAIISLLLLTIASAGIFELTKPKDINFGLTAEKQAIVDKYKLDGIERSEMKCFENDMKECNGLVSCCKVHLFKQGVIDKPVIIPKTRIDYEYWTEKEIDTILNDTAPNGTMQVDVMRQYRREVIVQMKDDELINLMDETIKDTINNLVIKHYEDGDKLASSDKSGDKVILDKGAISIK